MIYYYPGERELIEETLLVEKLAMMDMVLTKEAGFITGMLGSVGDSIQNFAKEHVDTSSITTILTSLGNLMAPAILFGISPWLGILGSIATAMGFDAAKVIGIIKNFVTGKLSQGVKPTLEEITNIGMSAVAGASGGAPANEADDMFYSLKDAEKKGGMMKLAQRGYFSEQVSGPWLGGNSRYGRRGPLYRIFGGLGRQRGRWLLGGFIVWIIKKLLVGAGLVAVAGAGLSMLGKGKEKGTDTVSPVTGPGVPAPPPPVPMPVQKPQFRWSGRGGQMHPNDSNSIWYVPMTNIYRTILGWTTDVYPEASLQKVLYAPSFKNLIGELQRLKQPGSSYIRIPNRFKSRKQVIDSFLNEISV